MRNRHSASDKHRLAIQKYALAALATSVGLGISSIQAQSTFTSAAASPSWGTAGNWSPSGVPSGTGVSVIFNTPTQNQSVGLGAARTVGSVSITNNSIFTFAISTSNGSLIMDETGTGPATIAVTGNADVTNTISGPISLTDSVTVTVSNTVTTAAAGALALTGSDISGNGGVTKNGGGVLTFSNAAKTYSGTTSITAGRLRMTESGQASGTSGVSVSDGAQLMFDSTSTRSYTLGTGGITLNGLGISGASALSKQTGALRQDPSGSSDIATLTNSIILATDSGIHAEGSSTLILSGGVSGNGGLVKSGSGILQLNAADSYGGNTAINNGTIKLSASGMLPTGTIVSLGQTGTVASAGNGNVGKLDLNGISQQVAGLNSTTYLGIDTISNKNTAGSSIAATLTIGGNGTYTYGNGTAANSGVITGAISIVKSGSGTQTFGDANTYTGGTTVSAGTLLVNNTSGSGTGTGAVGVSTNGTLGGTGSVSGAVTSSAATARFAPGSNAVGKLTFTSSLSLVSGATFNYELGAATMAGTTYDQLAIAGALSGSSAANGLSFEFTNISSGLAAGSAYTLLTYGSQTGLDYTDLNATVVPAGFTLDSSFGTGGWQINGTNLQVQFAAVPEPSTWIGGGLILGLAAFSQRKRLALALHTA